MDQARSKDDPSSLLAQQLGLLKKCKKGGRRRECSRRSRHESVGAFSFRRRLFLDASLINIKHAACARARGDSRRRNVAVFFYSGTSSRLLVAMPLPVYPFPSSIYPTPLHPEAAICRSLSMHRRYRQAGAVTGPASAGGHVGSRRCPDVNDAGDDVVSPFRPSLPSSSSRGKVRATSGHRRRRAIFALARGAAIPSGCGHVKPRTQCSSRCTRVHALMPRDAGGKEITAACHRAVPVAIGVMSAPHTPPLLPLFPFLLLSLRLLLSLLLLSPVRLVLFLFLVVLLFFLRPSYTYVFHREAVPTRHAHLHTF